jgi:hypothetical protein
VNAPLVNLQSKNTNNAKSEVGFKQLIRDAFTIDSSTPIEVKFKKTRYPILTLQVATTQNVLKNVSTKKTDSQAKNYKCVSCWKFFNATKKLLYHFPTNVIGRILSFLRPIKHHELTSEVI